MIWRTSLKPRFGLIGGLLILLSFALSQNSAAQNPGDPLPPSLVPINITPPLLPPIVTPVANANCSRCSPAINPGGTCCGIMVLGCSRTDNGPIVLNPGILRPIPWSFTYCNNCCKWEPDECHGNDDVPARRSCNFTAEWQVQVGTDISYEAGLELEAQELIKLKLGGGYSGGVTTTIRDILHCELSALKCRHTGSNATLVQSIGRKLAINHTWNLSGTIRQVNPSGSACSPPCPQHGHDISSVCRTGQSVSTIQSVASKGCDPIQTLPCPPRGPCN